MHKKAITSYDTDLRFDALEENLNIGRNNSLRNEARGIIKNKLNLLLEEYIKADAISAFKIISIVDQYIIGEESEMGEA